MKETTKDSIATDIIEIISDMSPGDLFHEDEILQYIIENYTLDELSKLYHTEEN